MAPTKEFQLNLLALTKGPTPCSNTFTFSVDCTEARDSSRCESEGGSLFPEDSCGLYYNAPEECPVQCRFCPGCDHSDVKVV